MRLTTYLFALPVFLFLAACSKKPAPATLAAASVVPAAANKPAAPSASVQENFRFTAEVAAHEEFQKTFAPKMTFRLEPYAGNDSGWSIRIAPIGDSGAPVIDCIGAVETPLHGDTKIEIEPPESGAAKSSAWRQREFEFVPTASDCQSAWELMNNANYNSKLSEKEREQADAKLGQIPTRQGKFTVLDAHFAPATSQDSRGAIEWLKFAVDLGGSAEPTAAVAAAPSANSGIRSIDLKPFVESHLGELNPDLADLATDCGDGQKPLQSLAPAKYGDLDGDGQEEAAIEGWSCLSGNGGADFRGVLKLLPDAKLAVLPMQPIPKTFKGRNPYADLRGHMVIDIKNGRLVELYPIYKDGDPNCCGEGGTRNFIYRWDGHQFVLDDIIDAPPEKGGA
jgi:hypothetical protein